MPTYDDYKVAVYTNLFTGIVYGFYIVLYVASVYVLLKKPGFTSSRPRMFMLGTTTFMFISGIIALVLVTTIMFQEMLLIDSELGSSASELIPGSAHWQSLLASYQSNYYAWGTITRLMYIVCDIICAWRTVVLWNRDKRVIAILLIFILGTTVAAVFQVLFDLGRPEGGRATFISGNLDLITVGPTLGTNLLSTGLIAWKAWQRRISVRKHLFESGGFVRADRIFSLLIESGLIYCCIWILYLISLFNVLPNPGFTVMAFVSGLYPTLIVILVCVQMSPVEHYSTHSNGMRFTSGSAPRTPRPDSILRQVVSIHREYSSDFDTRTPSTVMKDSDEESSLIS
ncbi:hypothetical protein EI94DRAFT_662411 [Lactarius quietus]|nr:hypothetical protein EI94DRAFT_1035837 [Lactarius quietus]KAF8262710.1 hypothetical protein EI94DRAFT_662411 [Lactarius quietus]